MIVLLLAACAGEGGPGAPGSAAPAVERGTGELAGMVHVPGAEVNTGPRGAIRRPPPGQHPVVLPSFQCAADEVSTGRCPGLAHDPLVSKTVRVSGFWIDETEVTRRAYGAFLAATGYRPPHVEEPWAEKDWNWDGPVPPAGTEDHPVVLTNWYDAREFCAWRGARLPTEPEWQLAVLGPAASETAYPWGAEYAEGRMNRGIMAAPNYDQADGWLTTSPVGAFPSGASRYGLLDGYGNAWEWVETVRMRSWEEVTFADASALLDLRTPTLGLYAGARGFSYFADPRPNLAMDYNAFPVELRRKTSGFRCARAEAAP